jgi:hypothetical protein
MITDHNNNNSDRPENSNKDHQSSSSNSRIRREEDNTSTTRKATTTISAAEEAKSKDRHLDILEQGDIFFFYRPKVAATEQVRGIEDIRRFFMVTAPVASSSSTRKEKGNQKNKNTEKQGIKETSPRYRLFVIGKKSLPEIRTTEARRSERYWAKVGGIFENPEDLSSELFASEYRKGDEARPVGEGKYAIIKHHDHAELAYILEIPKEPGEAQQELGIEKEASYIVSVINPKIPVPEGYPSVEQPPKYPKSILDDFDENENFISLDKNLDFINYPNAQVILIGARSGNDVVEEEMKIDIHEEKETVHSADIFNRLRIERENVPTKPLTEGKFE